MANLEKFNKVIFGLWCIAEKAKLKNPEYSPIATRLAELVDEINEQISANQYHGELQ